MYIGKTKIIAIFTIIIILLFENIFMKNVTIQANTYMPRRASNNEYELPDIENGYDMSQYGLEYLKNFMHELQKNPEQALIKYVDEECYDIRIKNNDKFMRELNEKAIILDTENNEHSVGYTTKYKNVKGQNILASYAIVLKKGLEYPEGYNILKNTNSKDKLKVMDIHVLEVSPYTFKIYFPDTTVIIEED